jgi:hypothetical protein
VVDLVSIFSHAVGPRRWSLRVLRKHKYWILFQFWYDLSSIRIAHLSPVYSVFQSVGACSGTCSGYAFAILQGHVNLLSLFFAHEAVMLVFELFSAGCSIIEPLQ